MPPKTANPESVEDKLAHRLRGCVPGIAADKLLGLAANSRFKSALRRMIAQRSAQNSANNRAGARLTRQEVEDIVKEHLPREETAGQILARGRDAFLERTATLTDVRDVGGMTTGANTNPAAGGSDLGEAAAAARENEAVRALGALADAQ